jgi:hypothetical protein
VGDEVALYCERCGRRAPLSAARAQFSFCLDCEFTVCGACWDADADRCSHCASATGDGNRTGVPVARRALFQLSAMVGELEEVERQAGTALNEPGPVTDVRWPFGLSAGVAMLEIAARDLSRVARSALDESKSRDRLTASELGIRLDDTVEDVQRHVARADVAVLQSAGRTGRAELGTISSAPARGLRIRRPTFRVSAVVALLVLVASVAALARLGDRNENGSRLTGATSAAPATSPGGVLSGRSSHAAAPSDVTQVTTFDELRMNTTLGDGWQIDGDETAVRIAPIPSVVDRSLELSRSTSGPTTACRTVTAVGSGQQLRITVDLMAESAARSAVLAFVAYPNSLELSLHGSEREIASGTAAQEIDAGRWYRSVAWTDPASSGWQWELTDLTADRRVLGTTILTGSSGPSIDEFCASLNASPGTELYLDDLTINVVE